MNVAVLMTCHNRRETTLRCLESLLAAIQDSEKCEVRNEKLRWDVFLVDDGSTDGTGTAVQEWADHHCQPSTFNLNLIAGSGNLYWSKGMAIAWREAIEFEKNHHSTPTPNTYSFFSHFLWLNDDTILRPDSLSALLHIYTANSSSVIVGSLIDESTGMKACGIKEEGIFTGNFVLVPRSVYEKVGMICDGFHHAWADSDYAMRCRRAGVKIVALENVGTTQVHDLRPTLKGVPLMGRVRSLFDPKGWCVHDLWLYRRRNWGVVTGICSALHLIVHVMKGDGE